MSTTYEGWSNYETWAVNLWLSNDEGLYHMTTEKAEWRKEESPDDLEDAAYNLGNDLSEMVEESTLGEEAPASLQTDLLTHALGMVDWREIAKAWVEA